MDVYLRQRALGFALHQVAKSNPGEAIHQLARLKGVIGTTAPFTPYIVSAWSLKDPDGAIEWILSEFKQDERQQERLLREALPHLVSTNPHRAFEIASELPAGSWNLEQIVIRGLTQNGNIDIAKELPPKVRSASKAATYALVGKAMITEKKPEEVKRLAEELKGRERGLYYVDVFSTWAEHDGEQLFEHITSFSSEHTRSLAARYLIVRNLQHPLLTEDQVETAKSYLTDRDRASVARAEAR